MKVNLTYYQDRKQDSTAPRREQEGCRARHLPAMLPVAAAAVGEADQMSKLMEEYLAGRVPEDLGSMEGPWAVRMVPPLLPEIRFFGQNKIFEKAQGGRVNGFNQFLGRIRGPGFQVERGKAGDLDVVNICYDIPSNAGIVRRLIDEVRMIKDDYYLGRGMYLFPGGTRRNVFWFSMRRD